MIHTIRITFGTQTQPQIEVQQGDYNSRTIQALCYTSSGRAMSFDGQTVSVVYSISGTVSAEYPVQVTGNVLSFTMPGLASASVGAGSMQVRIYGSESLLQSAIIPYVVKASLDPGPAEEDQVPMLVMLVQQAQQAIAECTAATDKANDTVADIEQKLADGAFIGPTGPTGPQGFQGVGVTGASLNGQGELVFTVTDPATGESRTLLPVDIDTSAAIKTVEQAAQDGVQKVQDAQASAISAVDQAGKTAGTQAVSEVYSAKDTAIADIATVKSGAESAITAAQQSAVQTVQQSGTTAVGQVQKAQNTATTAIAQAQQNAITSVENEGDAQVQRLQEIVPQPTADNNGMVVAVQSGAYQLENPAGLVLNDGVITSKNGWSSMQIVKMVCPPFTVSGSVVQCYPVANYPLSVQASWEPRQEGEGDPSPENVRPITGMDEVKVTRCGKNLLNPESVTAISGAYGLTVTYEGENIFHIVGKPNNPDNGKLSFVVAGTLDYSLAGKGLAVTAFNLSGNLTEVSAYGLRTSTEKAIAILAYLDNTVTYDARIQLAVGVENLAAYEPYTGTPATLDLPSTVYGGEVDAVTGEGVETWKCIVLDGAENWFLSGNNIMFYVHNLNYSISKEGLCSHLKYFVSAGGDGIYCIVIGTTMTVALGSVLSGQYTVDTWKSYLAAQAAAGTPVTIAYKLATPTPFQATGGQSLPALPGTNTVYTDAGDITVTGASDPIATITSLQSRVSALESAQTNM